MFCPKCGKELNTNNVCVNPSCPAYINNNNSINQGFGVNNQNQINNQNIGNNQNFNGNYGFNQNYPNQNVQNFNNSQVNMDNSFRDQNGISATEMMEFVGEKNSDYYIEQWGKAQENENFISWNWPAFFTNFLWFWHRKMYGIAAIIFGVGFIIKLLLTLIVKSISRYSYLTSRPIAWPSYIIALVVSVISSLLANQLYIKHATKKIRSIKSTASMGVDNDTIFRRLRSNGGTTWVPLFVAIGVFVLTILLLIVGLSVTSNYRYRSLF